MDKQTKALFEARAVIVKAMAHPSRLFIVECLSKKPHCVCELTALIGADISTVSKHLTMLKNAGIIVGEKKGTEIRYALRVPCILKFFSCVESVLRKNSEERVQLLA
jgi:DNA-binding transcriptional ArsR family regulator